MGNGIFIDGKIWIRGAFPILIRFLLFDIVREQLNLPHYMGHPHGNVTSVPESVWIIRLDISR
jgi:hypothetical protein